MSKQASNRSSKVKKREVKTPDIIDIIDKVENRAPADDKEKEKSPSPVREKEATKLPDVSETTDTLSSADTAESNGSKDAEKPKCDTAVSSTSTSENLERKNLVNGDEEKTEKVSIPKDDPVTTSSSNEVIGEPVSTKKQRQRRGKRSAKQKSKSTSEEKAEKTKDTTEKVANTTSKSKGSSRARKSPTKNHLLTEYFPVRRSDRTSRFELEKMETKILEEKILSGCENGLEVVDIEGKGRGVISTKPFKRGDFIVEYAGNLISLTEAQAKEDHYSQNPDIGCYMYYFKYGNKSYCVDATAESGKLGRLLNHSKSGNCRTKVVGIGDRPYLILIAARDIEKNEELLYDYGDRSKEALAAHPWLAL